MEYESYRANLQSLAEGLKRAASDWAALADGAIGTLKEACANESVDLQGLQDVRASLATEASFLGQLPERIEEYRTAIKGLRAYYEPEQKPPTVQFPPEEPTKGGWLFGLKRTHTPTPIAEPAEQSIEVHRDQRAFNEAKALLKDLDLTLEVLKTQIVKAAERGDDLAYDYKTEVVTLNADIRRAETDVRKKQARRFFLEDAVAILSERSAQLSLHGRAIGRLHSSEYVENPFDD